MPFIEAERKSGGDAGIANSAGKVLMATVKGDVHDIGKNIVSVVLRCNNIEVIDAGVMTPCAKILDMAEAEKVDIIGLSGLITPSLEEMTHVASEMSKRNMKIPLMVGGATTSRLHTALKISPQRTDGGICVHVLDASKSVSVVNSLLNPNLSAAFASNLDSEYKELRQMRSTKRLKLISYNQANTNAFTIDWKANPPPSPATTGITVIENQSIDELISYIDWRPFFKVWEMRGGYPRILQDAVKGPEAKKLLDDAKKMLAKIADQKNLTAKGVFGIFPANSKENDIAIFADSDKTRTIGVFHTLRQQTEKTDGTANFALSDFIADVDTGLDDHIGMFAVTTGFGAEELSAKFADAGDDYSAIMVQALADRLAEAFAELLHERVRKEFWAYAPNEKASLDQLLACDYQGIRPAPGYPSCPNHAGKNLIFDLLDATAKIGVGLTETAMMTPTASVSGFYFAHPDSQYFPVSRIDEDQLADFAARSKLAEREVRRLLAPLLD
jgi:5-methyltetrahydrofolate--homocysteine methyltransferase